MQPLFIGSHPAIDFLNTTFTPDGQVIETIGDGRSFLDWLVKAGHINEADASKLMRRLGAKGADGVAKEARRIREWVRSWLQRWREAPTADYEDEIAFLNGLLAREAFHHEVVEENDGFNLVERPRLESADALVALLAMQIAALITQEQAALIKRCAGHGCSLWFLDRTKAHRRMFCSATGCGNRAKVAAFRQRQRE